MDCLGTRRQEYRLGRPVERVKTMKMLLNDITLVSWITVPSGIYKIY